MKWGIAAVCSLVLTLVTIVPPTLPGDWARLNSAGAYIPLVLDYPWPSYLLQFGLWLGIIVPLLLTLNWKHQTRWAQKPDSRILFAVMSATLLGFGLRLYRLDQLPLIIDEIGFAARASDMLHDDPIPIFAPGHNGNPATYSWLMAGSMSLFGQTRWAMRLISLIAGTLTIPSAYLLVKQWLGYPSAWIAAFVIAVYPAQMHFSRLALYNSIDPMFMLLSLTALHRGLRRPKPHPNHLLLAGMLAGIAQYFYHGSRLLLLLVVIYVLLIAYQRHWAWRTIGRVMVTVGIPLLLVSLPRFAPMFTAGLPLTGNLDGVRLPVDLADNALRAVMAWVGQPDISPFWLSDSPLLPLLMLIAFVLGTVLSLKHLTHPMTIVLLLFLALTTVFGGVIWPAAPLYVRYMTALPAIILLVMRPIQYGRMRHSWLRWASLVFTGVLIIQGIVVSIQHRNEEVIRVRPGIWEADALAQQATHLRTGAPVIASVSVNFSEVERITFADWVAAYGERRRVQIESPSP